MRSTSRIDRTSLITGIVVLVAALVLFAVLFAVRPYHRQVEFDGIGHVRTAAHLVADGQCDAAVSTAWLNPSSDQLRLWAVTVGTDMMGYTSVEGGTVQLLLDDGSPAARFPAQFCAAESRHRLVVSASVLVAAALGILILVVVAGARRHHA